MGIYKKLRLLIVLMLLQIPWVVAQVEEHEEWKVKRSADLIAENGWLNLAGLLWLEPGENHLVFVEKDSLALSSIKNKGELGTFHVTEDEVKFIPSKKAKVINQGVKVSELIQYPIAEGKDGNLQVDRWKWSVIKRGDRFAVRVRDLEHPALAKFEPIPTYDYDSKWRVDAFFEPRFNQFISITNVLGQVIEWRVMGILKFEVEGKKHEIITLEDEGKLFVIFSDETNGLETYPSGRYLHVEYPDKTGHTGVDFNYAYNPPCAFTAYATCPIPPKENRLNFDIEAGEKLPKGH